MTEACGIRDDFGAFKRLGVQVIGVSPGTVRVHAGFKARLSLPFTLLADRDHRMAEAFGVWGERVVFGGRLSVGVQRTTFIVGPDLRIRHVFSPVRARGHATQLLEALQRPRAASSP